MKVSFLVVATLFCLVLGDCSRLVADPLQSASICIEYFGEQASPILPLIISNSDAASRQGVEQAAKDTHLTFSRPHVVTASMEDKFLVEFRKIHNRKEVDLKSYVVFHVVVIQDGRHEMKVIDGPQALILTETLKNICQSGPLFDDLVYLQKVIKAYQQENR